MSIPSQVPNELVTTDLILGWLKEQVENHRFVDKELWLDAAFKLNLLQADEDGHLEALRQNVAQIKLEILKGQEKRNVAAAEAEIEASDEYKFYKLQEHKVDRIIEFIKLAKKNGSNY